jgi:hypothetical protein
MDSTTLEERVSRLEALLLQQQSEVHELRRENQSLRTAAVTTAVAPTENASLPRRDLLKGAAYALGAVSLSLMGARPAEATIGTMSYGQSNDAGSSGTVLDSSSAFQTLLIRNVNTTQGDALVAASYGGHAVAAYMNSFSSEADAVHAEHLGHGHAVYAAHLGSGHAVYAIKPSDTEIGHAVLAYQKHPTSLYAAIAGVTSGAGPGLHGRGEGSGQGVWGQIADATKAQSAILGTTEGTGAAVEGKSIKGRGGVFQGKKAQVRLVASTATNKPSTGTRGDLFVDSSGRLWYCKTSAVSTGWVQLA